MRTRVIPLIGVGLASILFLIAAARFPGGYHWTRDYVSTLLRSAPEHPLPPDVRMPAIGAILSFAAALGFLFYQLSIVGPSRTHRKLLQIAGIASMIYASFTMTPMHDLMVTLSLVSFLVAAAVIMHWLYLRRARSLLCFGALSLGALGVAAVLYFGGFFGPVLSVAQKISMSLCMAWLLLAHASLMRDDAQKEENVSPSDGADCEPV